MAVNNKLAKEYVVSTKAGQMYRSYFKIPLPFYCFGNSDIIVTYAIKYSEARKFRSLRWATHRARYLSKHTRDYYYVFTSVEQKNGLHLMKTVDDTLNDRLIENNRNTYKESEKMIEEWKEENSVRQ